MMTSGPGPITSRRRLRMALRQLRLTGDHSLEDIRAEMDWSLSKVMRIESGMVSISVNDLRALLAFYGVVDPDEVDCFVDLARSARRRHWAGQYREYVSTSYMDFLGYEDDASRISQYHPFLIPDCYRPRTTRGWWPQLAHTTATARPSRRGYGCVWPDKTACSATTDTTQCGSCWTNVPSSQSTTPT